MAWDRRLLSRSQYLCILISGFRGNYPAISPDGTLNPVAQQFGTALNFKVGLTPRYKPGKEFAKDAARTFGLIINDAEDDLRIQAEKAAAFESLDLDVEADPYAESALMGQTVIEEPEEEDEGGFDRFSLSSSLESLLDQALLKVIQIRRQFGLGWAGAEVLFAEVERTQMKAEDIYNRHREVFSSFTLSSACLNELDPAGDFCSR
jgi:ubiquitin-conjugating enzyme E2 Q